MYSMSSETIEHAVFAKLVVFEFVLCAIRQGDCLRFQIDGHFIVGILRCIQYLVDDLVGQYNQQKSILRAVVIRKCRRKIWR